MVNSCAGCAHKPTSEYWRRQERVRTLHSAWSGSQLPRPYRTTVWKIASIGWHLSRALRGTTLGDWPLPSWDWRPATPNRPPPAAPVVATMTGSWLEQTLQATRQQGQMATTTVSTINQKVWRKRRLICWTAPVAFLRKGARPCQVEERQESPKMESITGRTNPGRIITTTTPGTTTPSTDIIRTSELKQWKYHFYAIFLSLPGFVA